MRQVAGQAVRHGGRVVRLLAELMIAVAVLAGVGTGALAWRLSQGPLDLPWLTTRLQAVLNQDDRFGQIRIGTASLAWEGFRLGVDHPLDIQLRDVSFADRDGRQLLTVPRAGVSVSLHLLLLGRIAPRALEIDQPHIALVRMADGSIAAAPQEPATDATPLLALLRELTRPPATDRNEARTGPLSQLRRLRIRDASAQVVDAQFGMTWWAPRVDLELTRQPRGGVDGTVSLTIALGGQEAKVNAAITLPAGAGPIAVRLRATPVEPAAVARLLHLSGPWDAIEAPVSGEVSLTLDDAMNFQSAHMAVEVGKGIVTVADGVLPVTQALVIGDLTRTQATLRTLRLQLPSSPGNPVSVIRAKGTATRDQGRYQASLELTLDQVAFADLPGLWPLGVGHGARAWVTENITAGVARDGHVAVGLEAGPELSDVKLIHASGSLIGEGLRVSWLAPVPPIADGTAVLTIVDPDTLDITVRAGRQEPEPGMTATRGGLVLRGGRMRITGIMHPHQFGTLDADIAGPVPDAIALLRDPRLRLLSKHPLPLNDPAGTMTAHLAMTIPLEANVTMDDIGIQARARLEGVHLSGLVAGRDVDDGVLDLHATAQGLNIAGQARIGGIQANVTGEMDFRAGRPSQVLQRISVTGRPTTRQLASIGLDVAPVVDGVVGVTANVIERRDGAGEISVRADLTPAAMAFAPLGWRKPPGQAATMSGVLRLSHDRLTAIDSITLEGDGFGADGSVSFVDGKPATVRVDQAVLGRSRARATIQLPVAGADRAGEGQPIAVSVTGPSLDLSGQFSHQTPRAKRKPERPSGPHWTLDARFDQVLMANDHRITGLAATLDSDGGITRRLNVRGETGPKAPFMFRIAAAGGRRTLEASAADAGNLLASLDIVSRMQGGQLNVSGTYDDARIEHPLSGTAQIDDFRVRDAPALARLLQGMTLYGLVELMRGPGLGFTHLVAPFELSDDALTLTDARAFSASLGLTAKGTIDLAANTAEIDGTIVPAYFFNSLLGNIPLVGRLFSPERGGGVFAANYTVRGSLDDPSVSINPLSALTPGFLRGLFGLF